jgi:hypothetical protein
MVWEQTGVGRYAAGLHDDAGSPRCRLFVKQLPEGMWDWTIWEWAQTYEMAMRGVARSANEAMQRAEESVDETDS